MKARHIRKIRKTARYFLVQKTDGLFGEFWNHKPKYRILARNEFEAAKRFAKRKISVRYEKYNFRETDQKWAKFRVVPEDRPYERFTKYLI